MKFIKLLMAKIQAKRDNETDECFKRYGKTDVCYGLYGGDEWTCYTAYQCIGCKHFECYIPSKKNEWQ